MPNCFTPREIYTRFRTCLHQEPFTQENLQHEGRFTHLYFTRRISTPEPFYTTRPLYINTNRLHKKRFTQRQFEPNAFDAEKQIHETTFHNTELSIRNRLHQKPFDTRSFYTRHMYTMQLSHQKAFSAEEIFSPKNFYSETLLKPGTRCFLQGSLT